MSNLATLFGDKLQSKNGEVDTISALSDCDAIGIYFSAHWCPPCRGFTPVFAKNYELLKEAGKKVEVIFASSDQDDAAFKDYFSSMPWLALPYEKRELKEELAKKYKCNGIPYLVFLDAKTLETITTNGRGGVTGKTFVEDFPYHPKPMYDVSESMDGIMEMSLFVVQDQASKEVQKVNTDFLTELAIQNKKNTDKIVQNFFTGNGGGPLGFIKGEIRMPSALSKHEHELPKSDRATGWICNGCRKNGANCIDRYRCEDCDFDYCEKCIVECENAIPEDMCVPKMVVLDVKNKKYFDPVGRYAEVNKENVLAFLQEVKEGKIESKLLASEE